MLTEQDWSQMEADRLLWVLGQIGEAEHRALNAVMDSGDASPSWLTAVASLYGARPNLLLAMFGWLPMRPSGGGELIHLLDIESAFMDAYVIDERHRWAVVFFQDIVQQSTGARWSAFPTIHWPPLQ